MVLPKDFNLRRERVIFFRRAKAQCVLRVVTISDFERSCHPLSIGGNSASQQLLRDRNSGLYNRQDLEKDTLF